MHTTPMELAHLCRHGNLSIIAVIWHTVPSFTPLLLTLPADTWCLTWLASCASLLLPENGPPQSRLTGTADLAPSGYKLHASLVSRVDASAFGQLWDSRLNLKSNPHLPCGGLFSTSKHALSPTSARCCTNRPSVQELPTPRTMTMTGCSPRAGCPTPSTSFWDHR
ncbi:hypothetical protein C8Q80DRAFT_307031 [Daedaleopsis nitida]|nr:hypothetical protein C8Q80DRAFT_307031 [Daedaleopsis nitida]